MVHVSKMNKSHQQKAVVCKTIELLLRPIYTARLCHMRQAYDRPTT